MTHSERVTADHPAAVFGPVARLLAPVLEHLRDGCILIDDEMRIGCINAVGRDDLRRRGEEPDRFPGESLWELLPYPPDMPARVAVERAVHDRVRTQFSMQGVYSSQWIEAEVIPLDSGVVMYYRDVTWHQAAEQARVTSESQLRATSDRLQLFIEAAPIAIVMLDEQERVIEWNPAAVRMFQWTADEVLGQPLPTIPPEERGANEALRARRLSGEPLAAIPVRRVRRDGVILDVQLSVAPLRNATSEIVGVVAMLVDVSANRKLEAQLRLAQKMEAVGLLAGGVAHDFNNLLTAIKGFASLLQLTITDGGQADEFLEEINKAADRAAALTAQLLAFSRRQLLRPEPLDLNARVRDLERMLRLLLRDNGELVLELDAGSSDVLADPGQVEQVILNLVVNARDAVRGRPDARVTIATRRVDLRDEFAAWGVPDAPGPYVQLNVSDNGAGMDAATLSRIFDPFFTTKEPGQGTGLGLATVFGIVKQSGGYIWASSEPGAGATFAVYLPRARHPARTSGPTTALPERANELVLLVEDEAAVRRVVKRALELQGYRVLDAANGDEAIDLAQRHDVTILVSDVMMPGMLGPQVAEAVRKVRPGIPVLLMSGHADEISRRGLVDPDTPFLAKPFTPGQLQQKVADVLRGAPRP